MSASLSQVSPGTGSIYAISTPQGAAVYVDGRYYGTAPRSQAASRSGITRFGSRFQGSRTGQGVSMSRTGRLRP